MQINNEVLILEIRKMKSGLVTYSTGQKWEEGESEYKRIRELLLQDKNLRSMIPSFVIKYRDLGDYWDFIKIKFGHYSERRKYLVEEFSQLFDYFEFNDQNNEYSGEIKKKLIQWLSEANEFEIVKNINLCEFIFEPYPDLLIPVNGDIPYDPYILIIRAPRKAYDLLEDNNGVKQKIFDAVNALLQDHDALIEIKVSPLVGDTVFSHQSFSAIKATTSVEIQETWKKLLDRVSSDPEGSITTARALVEGVCKYIYWIN